MIRLISLFFTTITLTISHILEQTGNFFVLAGNGFDSFVVRIDRDYNRRILLAANLNGNFLFRVKSFLLLSYFGQGCRLA